MKRPKLLLGLLIATMTALPVPLVRADLTNFDSFGSMVYSQTANDTAPSGPPSYFYASRLFYDTSGDITDASGSITSGPSFTYANQPGNYSLFQTPFISQSQLAAYQAPGSDLQFTVNGGNLAGQSGDSGPFGQPLYTSAVPYVTNNTYNNLQGLDSTQATTIAFNNFAAVNGSNEADIFVTITNVATGAAVYQSGALSNTANSILLTANTLVAGTGYNLEVDFSSRLNSYGTFGNDSESVPFLSGYDTRTEIGFVTAGVPEPASLVLTTLGLVSALLIARKRRASPKSES